MVISDMKVKKMNILHLQAVSIGPTSLLLFSGLNSSNSTDPNFLQSCPPATCTGLTESIYIQVIVIRLSFKNSGKKNLNSETRVLWTLPADCLTPYTAAGLIMYLT